MGRSGKYYAISVVLTFWSCIYKYNWNVSIYGSPGYVKNLTANTYLYGLFAGAEVLNRDSIQLIRIPGVWLLFYLGMFCMNERYFSDLFSGIEVQAMLRERRITFWWDKKCMRAVMSILLYYSAAWIPIWCIGFLSCGETALFDSMLNEFFLPLLVSLVLCMAQALFVLWGRGVLSLLAVMGYLLVSVYWEKWYLLGNYLMLGRSKSLEELRVHRGVVCVIAIMLLVIIWRVNHHYLKRVDLQR